MRVYIQMEMKKLFVVTGTLLMSSVACAYSVELIKIIVIMIVRMAATTAIKLSEIETSQLSTKSGLSVDFVLIGRCKTVSIH